MQNLTGMTIAIMNVILGEPTVGAKTPLAAQTAGAAWSLLGVPFILCGFFGLYNKQGQNMRLYFYYLVVSFALDICFAIGFFVTTDFCAAMPEAVMKHGFAFACGFMRLQAIGSMLLIIAVLTYCMFTVQSYCEELEGAGSNLGNLLSDSNDGANQLGGETRIKRMTGWDMYGNQTNMYGTMFGDKNYGAGAQDLGYSQYQDMGQSGRQTVFSGETSANYWTPQTKSTTL